MSHPDRTRGDFIPRHMQGRPHLNSKPKNDDMGESDAKDGDQDEESDQLSDQEYVAAKSEAESEDEEGERRRKQTQPRLSFRSEEVGVDVKDKGKGKATARLAPLHLDGADAWRLICDWTHRGSGDVNLFAHPPCRKVFDVPDFQLLLEAMRCQTQGMDGLRDACIRLYLLVRRYNLVSSDIDDSTTEAFFDQLSEEDLRNRVRGKVHDIIHQVCRTIRAPTTPLQAGATHGDETPLSVSQMTLSPHQGHSRRKSGYAPSLPFFEEAGSNQTPSQSAKAELEPGFHVKDSKWFSVGRVFIMLWHENATGANRYLQDVDHTTEGPYGQRIYSHVRRFAVVRQCHGFSWAVPVNTYHGKGIGRPGFNEDDHKAHAIIYMERTKPVRLPGEPEMEKHPIMVEYTSDDKKLHDASRVRFDKVFSIEHNVKVKNVGRISKKSMAWFSYYWQMEAHKAIAAVKAGAAQTK